MAITTQAGLVAGLRPAEEIQKLSVAATAAVLQTLWYAVGRPAAASAPTPGINGAVLTPQTLGQIQHVNPAAGNAYLARFQLGASIAQPGTLFLADRIWHNSGIVVTTTTEQAIVTPAFTNRDRNGASLGHGIMLALECSAVCSNAALITNCTVRYTNQDGTGSRTAIVNQTVGIPASFPAANLVNFYLQDGDTGVRSIEGITLGTSLVTGTVHLVAFRNLAVLDCDFPASRTRDAFQLGLVRLYDNTVPWLFRLPTTTTATLFLGHLMEANG